MAESNTCLGIPESNMEILKEALRAQQQLLQKVYFELEEERDASSSAASEAMLKILRLQAEKAQVKMEASQYKREAEEKMCFAEESLAIFEDLMYQKEMEIANLEFQVQAYTHKLLDVGCTDLTIPEDQYPESPNQLRNDPDASETASHRSISSTAIVPKDRDVVSRKSITIERERPAIPIPNLFQKKSGNSIGALNAYREQIKKLGEQVNKISDDRFARRSPFTSSRNRFRSCSVPPPNAEQDTSTSLPASPQKHGVATVSDLPKIPNILVQKKAKSNSTSPSGVRDF